MGLLTYDLLKTIKYAFFVILLIFDQKSAIFGSFYQFSISDGVITEFVLLTDERSLKCNKFGLSFKLLGRVSYNGNDNLYPNFDQSDMEKIAQK